MKSPMERPFGRGMQPISRGEVGVYGIACGDFVKVGVAADIWTRFRALELTCPYPMALVVWRQYPTRQIAERMESALHIELASQSHWGEWFKTRPVDPVAAVMDQYERERHVLGLPEVVTPIDLPRRPKFTAADVDALFSASVPSSVS